MATSGVFTGARGGDSNGPYLTLNWSRLATDIPNNRSQIRLTLRLVSTYALYFSASTSGNLHGTSFTYTSGFSGTGTVTLKTIDVWVNHNADGSKSQSFSASFNLGVSWGNGSISSLSVSGTAVIDSIPRASLLTAFTVSNAVLRPDTTTTINYTIDRKHSAFTHQVTLSYKSYIIATWAINGTGAQSRTISAAEVNALMNNMPTSSDGNLKLTLQTRSGTSNIGVAQSRTVYFSISSAVVPTAHSLWVGIAGTGRDKTLNKYIQSVSKVSADFGRTASYGAYLSSSNIVVRRRSDNGNSQTIASANGTTANALTLAGVYSVIATVIDSRGRSASVETTINVEAYTPPTIATFVTNRKTDVSSDVTSVIKANWSLGANNPATVSIVGVSKAGVSQTLYTLTSSTAGVLDTTRTFTGQSDASAFTYTITITDSFGKVAKATQTVGQSFVELTISKGKGIGVGKIHERGALDVVGKTYLSGNANVLSIVGTDHAYIEIFGKGLGNPRTGFFGKGTVDLEGIRLTSESGPLQLRAPNDSIRLTTGNTENTRNWEISSIFNGRIVFNGTGSSLKFFESDSAGLQARNANDTAFVPIAASAFNVNSQREMKHGIELFELSEMGNTALEEVCETPVYKYHYHDDTENEIKRTGVIIDTAPLDIVSLDGVGIDTYQMLSLAYKAIQELNEKVVNLENTVALLSGESDQNE